MAPSSDEQRDLKLEALVPVVKGDLPLFIITEDSRSIRDAVNFCDKNKVKMILGSGTAALEVKDLLKEKNIPVVLQPTLTLVAKRTILTISRSLWPVSCTLRKSNRVRQLHQWVRSTAFPAGRYFRRVWLAARRSAQALTLYPAQMFGVDKELGSIEPGKMGISWSQMATCSN